MSEFIAYPLEILNETYLQLSHAHVNNQIRFFHTTRIPFILVEYLF